jgi:glutaconate CoA-transferase subunit B
VTTSISAAEIQAVVLARDFRPDDLVFQVGANLSAARAACMMANLTTHPNARLLLGVEIENLTGGRPVPPVPPFLFHAVGFKGGEANMHQSRMLDDMSSPDIFFVGGIEVDRVGNVNLTGVPGEGGTWKVRGPGPVLLPTMSTFCRGYYILMGRHDPRAFVQRVSHITALGDRKRRVELGFPGGGPRLLLSPLGVFDFDKQGSMRLRSLHEGVTVDQVREATGFELVVPSEVPTTSPPTEAELDLLRNVVDREGILRDATSPPTNAANAKEAEKVRTK